MNEVTNNGTQSQKCVASNITKEQFAISEFRVHFPSHVQKLMLQAGYSHSELTVYQPTYLQFLHQALSCSLEKLHCLKYELSQNISDEERKYLMFLKDKTSLNEDPKLGIALNIFNEGLPQYLKKQMLNAGYEASESEENNDLFIAFFSSVLIIESKKLIKYNSVLSNDQPSKKKRSIDACSQPECTTLNDGNKSKLIQGIVPFQEVQFYSIQLIKTTKRHCIYCVSTPSGIRALKTTTTDYPTIEHVQKLDNELKIAKHISFHAFRKCYDRTIYQNKKALLLEWAHGNPLSGSTRFTVPSFIKLAREIVSCLLAMHMNKICHLHLTCDHIIFNSESNSIKVIGCGSSSPFSSKLSYNPKLIDRDLRYISPEQTGRVNREVDFRSDLYSLGIIFYRLLAGRYPYDNTNAMKLVHMHIFQESLPLYKIDPNIPLPISDMISKLMEKNVDLRYQSAKGIMYDIDLIISEYKPGLELILAQHDISETPILPQKLYGRTAEYSTLLSVLNRIVTSSSFELVFVKGNSGTGKSALVSELNKSVVQNGKFISGKYDISKFTPYSALIEAMKMFCDDILLEDELTVGKYRSLIQDAVGEEGKLLTTVIDNLHCIIGQQPDTSESYGHEAKNRFNYVFIKFIKAIVSASCPLVVVLEDIQWIDLASLDLITVLVKGSIKNLMLIAVYRDNEIKDTHIILNFFNQVKNMNISTTEIKLNNMDHECMNEFISDTLCVPPLETYPLTAFIYNKTEGNPFFVKQLLNCLIEQKSITFSPEKHEWQWDDCIYSANDIAETVCDLLRQKMLSFHKYTQQALKIASCLGSPFSLSSLKLIISSKKGVEDALLTGMITQYKGCDMACFVHDQVQHAAKSLLPKDPKPVFLYVATKLWKFLPIDDLMQNICVVVNLFYNAQDMISEKERLEIAELFLFAGEKVMASTASDAAFKYLKFGVELLDRDSWKTRYTLSLNLYCSAAKSAYCMTNYERMNDFIKEIFKNATNTLDLVTPNLLLIKMHSDKRMYEDAIRTAISILDKLDKKIDLNQSITRTEILQTRSLAGEPLEKILEIRNMDDRGSLSVIDILNCILYSSYFSGNRSVFASAASKMVQLTLKDGISKYSCFGFCAFAVVLFRMGDKMSYDFGKFSLKLLDKSNAKEMIPVVNVTFYTTISPFFASLHCTLVPLRRVAHVSLEIGLHHFSSSIVAAYFFNAFVCGESLSELIEEIGQFEELLSSKTKQHLSTHQAMLNLHNVNIANPAILSGAKFDYKYCFGKDGVKNDVLRSSLICCVIAYIFYDFETASKLIEICRSLTKYFVSDLTQIIFYFYDGLVSASMARNEGGEKKYIKSMEQNILKLKRISEKAPENYLTMLHLLEAELAGICKKESEAKSHYQVAISLSNKHGFPNHEAIACERAAIFYLDLHSQPDAIKLLLQSYNCYKVWGANSKMHHLIQRYPFLVAALKASAIALDKSHEDLVSIDMETISVLTDYLSVNIS